MLLCVLFIFLIYFFARAALYLIHSTHNIAIRLNCFICTFIRTEQTTDNNMIVVFIFSLLHRVQPFQFRAQTAL